jgi:hypothetical protein
MFNSNKAFLLVQNLKSAPKGFTLGVKSVIYIYIFSICPKLLTLWLCISPQAEIMNTIAFGKPICNSWGPMFQQLFIKILDLNVLLAFISNLGPKQQSKNAQSWP